MRQIRGTLKVIGQTLTVRERENGLAYCERRYGMLRKQMGGSSTAMEGRR
jgi:hypothetical protein